MNIIKNFIFLSRLSLAVAIFEEVKIVLIVISLKTCYINNYNLFSIGGFFKNVTTS
jgi:hypothetical protein